VQQICKVEGCKRFVYAFGICKKCRSELKCEIEGCGLSRDPAYQFCNLHHMIDTLEKYSKKFPPSKKIAKKKTCCTFSECTSYEKFNGFCQKHIYIHLCLRMSSDKNV
jgi:hypothetical protein